jgi:glucose/arabinose dehydrogenase
MKFVCTLLIAFASINAVACTNFYDSTTKATTNAGLTLPNKFIGEKVIENAGRARHIVVTDNGIIYVKLMRLMDGKGILQIQNGVIIKSFGNYNGTGIAIKNNYLYVSSDNEVFRYLLNESNEVINTEKPETIVTGLINRRQHESKSIALDNAGNLYVNIGAYSNSCQEKDRQNGSKGMLPCPILDSAGGIWKFSASKQNQSYADAIRYATGLRNVVGLDWNNVTNSLFVMQHGRDQLSQMWSEFYNEKDGAEQPAECMYELHEGSNAGWPYTYYDNDKKQIMVAPEYGGNGKLTYSDYIKQNNTFSTRIPGSTDNKTLINDIDIQKRAKQYPTDKIFQQPTAAYPAHLAPNALLFYTGNKFPEKYKNGAFIAFHGSWNRAPLPQSGFFVVFQPFKNGKPFGEWEIFADGFSEKQVVKSTREAVHRPCGLAQDKEGNLYVTDDGKGTIYKIGYNLK